MKKSELFELIKKHSINYTSEWILRDAVEAYLSASNDTNCVIGGELPPTLDLQQEAEEAWERENREFSNRGGINPYAYVLGYKAGAKRECR